VYERLARLETAIEHLNQGFCIFDRQHKLVLCNSRYASMHRLPQEHTRPGTPLRRILGRRYEIGIRPIEDLDECIRRWTKSASASQPSKTMIGFKDGRVLCRDHLPISEGGFVAIFEDVTEGLATAAELDRTKSFLNAVVENIPATVMVKGVEDRRYIFANRSAEQYLGRPRTDIIGSTAHDLFSEAGAAGVDRRDDEVLRSESGYVFSEYTASGRNGERRICTSRRVVMKDQEGRPAYILLVLEDVTEHVTTKQALEHTRNFLNTVIDHIPAVVLVKDTKESRYTLVNRAAERFFGVARADMIGRNCYDIFSKEQADAIVARDDIALSSGQDLTIAETSVDIPGQGVRQVTSRRLILRDAVGEPQAIVQVLEDQTQQLATQAELDRARNFLHVVIENIPTPVIVKDARELRYVIVNRAAERLFGFERSSLIGKTCHDVYSREQAEDTWARDEQALRRGGEITVREGMFHPASGEPRSVIEKMLTINDAAGQPQYLVIVVDDVTEQKRSAERIAFMAHHDPLTGLPNRVRFSERLDMAFEEALKSQGAFAILCIDIDRFKEINDVFGHGVGDEFLRIVARRLQQAAGSAFLARLGGDEFTMISPIGPQPAIAEALVERLFDTACGDVEIEGHQTRISVSVGISVFPADGAEANTVLSNADAALYRAKREGRNTFRFFDSEMDRRTRERHALQHDLRAAIGRGELVLHYQPQARMKGEVIGFEALIRWIHPVRGLILPGNFIPAAEENGLIVQIGEWTLREACREAASWEAPLQIALNLSPVQFRYGDLPGLVHRVLLETGLNPSRLELEITESALVGDFSRAVSTLRRLKALGVKIAMDDFGTGYSSLSYLQAFPFDKIKIDRSFIMNLSDNPQAVTIVRAVIGLARGLDLPVIAEGVETEDQLAFLTREDCDEVQGYLIGRPCPIDHYAGLTDPSLAETQRTLLAG
jgi:diguanylate cyclase (GGDEF)-like protein/PAS domain S-box-containing protein